MRLDKHLSRQRIIDISSRDLKGALDELLTASIKRFADLDHDSLLEGLMQRECNMTTYLGHGVALPHLRVRMKRKYVLALGRSREGLRYEGLKETENVHLMFLLLAGEDAHDYLQVLASIARLIKEKEFVDTLIGAPDLDALYERLQSGAGGLNTRRVDLRQSRINRLIFRQAERVARGAHCSAIAIFGDTLPAGLDTSAWFPDFRTLLVSGNLADGAFNQDHFAASIQVRSFSRGRLAQLRSAVLVGLTRGIIHFNDRICCVGGIPDSRQFDTIVVVDVKREFQTLLADQTDILPADVKPEVLERVIAVAMELAVEGREGKPVGSLFVLGDTSKVERMVKPLVLNPFFGYKEEDRNILNPFMDETIKEFSSIDGSFVIRGDGVVMSAGSLIHAPDYYHALPGGLGSRHAAAAAISLATQCIAIVVSSSTGQVTVFRRGIMLPLFDKALGS
jgi:diadenylate cyclase